MNRLKVTTDAGDICLWDDCHAEVGDDASGDAIDIVLSRWQSCTLCMAMCIVRDCMAIQRY